MTAPVPGYRYDIDLGNRLIMVAFEGTLNPAVVAALRDDMSANPDFNPAHHMIIDGRGITGLEGLGAEVVRSLARDRGSMHVKGALRVFVLTRNLYYGLTRMFAAVGDRDGDMAVFRDYNDALAWIEENRRDR